MSRDGFSSVPRDKVFELPSVRHWVKQKAQEDQKKNAKLLETEKITKCLTQTNLEKN